MKQKGAIKRIRREAREQTGALDLTGIELSRLPDALATAHLDHVTSLSLDGPIESLEGIGKIPNLRDLNLQGSQITTLEPLADLKSLERLICSYTRVTSLEPVSDLPELWVLQCVETRISDLRPLARMPDLQVLDISFTDITDLGPLAKVESLHELFAFPCATRTSPEPILRLPNLKTLRLGPPQEVEGDFPSDLLSKDQWDDCLERLRDHFGITGLPLPP